MYNRTKSDDTTKLRILAEGSIPLIAILLLLLYYYFFNYAFPIVFIVAFSLL